ncbi:hypothetical protein KBB96_07925 [Luteolibacter ambystomatis]|uniref:Uncharacterized protein n=1 Tax=Luteolibacter ambystomatis TaxID=2824561 RepID=A0A975PGQ3_9BACT|nr:hypothetical protein [Luteolibacter ambystomatis]QUE52810.1 hypothetical protein KBB96_07925 [Luteolibacter ambystomatis]
MLNVTAALRNADLAEGGRMNVFISTKYLAADDPMSEAGRNVMPDTLSHTLPLLAAMSAQQAGQLTVIVVMAVAVPALFILSLVRLIMTKKPVWIAGLIVSVLLGIGGLGAGVTALIRKAREAESTPTVVSSTDHHIRARIPGHWKTMTDLNKQATLQVGNTTRTEFFVVISEPKAELELTLDEYADLASEHVMGALQKPERGTKTRVTIDGNPAIQYELKGTIQKVPLVYLQTTVESADGFHQLIMWTIQSKQAIAFPIFKDVLESLKVEETAKTEES